MLLKIHTRGFPPSKALTEYTESKIRLSLGLFHDKVRRVDIFLTDLNGPKGGEAMSCKVKIKIDGCQDVLVSAIDENLYDAINICSHKAKRTVNRRFERLIERKKGFSNIERIHRGRPLSSGV